MKNIGKCHQKAAEGKDTIIQMYNESYKEKIAGSRLAFPPLQ